MVPPAIVRSIFLRHKDTRIYSWLGIVAASICLYLFGPQQFIIPAMFCILAVLFINYRKAIS